jgi:hypothetical protein
MRTSWAAPPTKQQQPTLLVAGPARATVPGNAVQVFESKRMTVFAKLPNGPGVNPTLLWFINDTHHRLVFDCSWTVVRPDGTSYPHELSRPIGKNGGGRFWSMDDEAQLPTDMSCTAQRPNA